MSNGCWIRPLEMVEPIVEDENLDALGESSISSSEQLRIGRLDKQDLFQKHIACVLFIDDSNAVLRQKIKRRHPSLLQRFSL